MSKPESKKTLQELTSLVALEKAGAHVDTSYIPEVLDWSGAVVGRFCGASIKKSSRTAKLLSSLSWVFKPRSVIQKLGLGEAITKGGTEPSRPNNLSDASGEMEQELSEVTRGIGSTYAQMTNPELVAEYALRMTEGAWREFMRRSQPIISAIVLATARRYGPVSRELADDLIQNVYVKLVANECHALRSFRTFNEMSLWAFLKVLAANTTRDYFRAAVQKRDKAYTQELFEKIPESTGFFPELERNRLLLSEINQVLKTHSYEPNFERNKTIFLLYYQQGYTAKEIAAWTPLGVTLKDVESILFLWTRRISSELQGTKKSSGT